MKWILEENLQRPIKSWCQDVEHDALQQAVNLANHPHLFRHVALMPDCHLGYGMPIGGVIASEKVVIPNAVGVDIGCGMGAIETDFPADKLQGKKQIRSLMDRIKARVPVGEGHARKLPLSWEGFARHRYSLTGPVPGWYGEKEHDLDARNLGTLGGGNHFIELQKSDTGMVWLMLHSGSRNLGHRVASFYHKLALSLNERERAILPDKNLAFLWIEKEGRDYIRDMNHALDYAAENRRIMMEVFKEAVTEVLGAVNFLQEINIHHNYAGRETHFGREVWVHRKGATSAHSGEKGIIPGSMGSASYIVEGLGNPESFCSCSHGAGRVLGRAEACRRLSVDECDRAMEGVVFDRWQPWHGRGKKKGGMLDLSEAPLAYKDIDSVIDAEDDLVKPLVRLRPLGVVKG